jgi:hypothetical protein
VPGGGTTMVDVGWQLRRGHVTDGASKLKVGKRYTNSTVEPRAKVHNIMAMTSGDGDSGCCSQSRGASMQLNFAVSSQLCRPTGKRLTTMASPPPPDKNAPDLRGPCRPSGVLRATASIRGHWQSPAERHRELSPGGGANVREGSGALARGLQGQHLQASSCLAERARAPRATGAPPLTSCQKGPQSPLI